MWIIHNKNDSFRKANHFEWRVKRLFFIENIWFHGIRLNARNRGGNLVIVLGNPMA